MEQSMEKASASQVVLMLLQEQYLRSLISRVSSGQTPLYREAFLSTLHINIIPKHLPTTVWRPHWSTISFSTSGQEVLLMLRGVWDRGLLMFIFHVVYHVPSMYHTKHNRSNHVLNKFKFRYVKLYVLYTKEPTYLIHKWYSTNLRELPDTRLFLHFCLYFLSYQRNVWE